MNFEEVFLSKKCRLCRLGEICHCCLGKCSNYGKRWVKLSAISTKINKLGTMGEGEEIFSKISELMHNALSNEKDNIYVRRNYHFCYLPKVFEILRHLYFEARSVISTKRNKLDTRGGGIFSKIPELMHNVLSNEKDNI